jgi:hypothetical protein
MKILKKFENYIKEDLDINPEADEISTEDLEAASDKYDEIAETEEESDDMLEEEDEYIGHKLLGELAKKLGTEVVNNQINYDGKKINFYSETEMFHVDKKKFKTIDEVIDFLTKSKK